MGIKRPWQTKLPLKQKEVKACLMPGLSSWHYQDENCDALGQLKNTKRHACRIHKAPVGGLQLRFFH